MIVLENKANIVLTRPSYNTILNTMSSPPYYTDHPVYHDNYCYIMILHGLYYVPCYVATCCVTNLQLTYVCT